MDITIIEGIAKLGLIIVIDIAYKLLPNSSIKNISKYIIFAIIIIPYIMNFINPKNPTKYKCDPVNTGECILSNYGKYSTEQECKTNCSKCAYPDSDHTKQLHYTNDCSKKTDSCNDYYSTFTDPTDTIFKYRCNMDSSTCKIDNTQLIKKKVFINDCSTLPDGDEDMCHTYYSNYSNKNYKCHMHDRQKCTIDKNSKALIPDTCPIY